MFCGLVSLNQSRILYFSRLGKRNMCLRFLSLEANWANLFTTRFQRLESDQRSVFILIARGYKSGLFMK